MTELRFILLVIGILILGAIYYFGRREQADDDTVARPETEHEPEHPVDDAMAEELERLGKLITAERDQDHASVTTGPATATGPAIPEEPERVISLFLRAKGESELRGSDITAAAEKVGLQYGDMRIYHRLHESEGKKVAVFSLANMMKPGYFYLEEIGTMTTRGICLFMPLPNPLAALDAWDSMLATGQRLADILNTELVDETQSTLSRQRTMSIREEMREYDRKDELGLG